MILERRVFSFSRTISSVGFPLNFTTAAMPPSTFLKLTVSWLGFGKLVKRLNSKHRSVKVLQIWNLTFLQDLGGIPFAFFVWWKDYLDWHFGQFSISGFSEDGSSHCYLLCCGILSKYISVQGGLLAFMHYLKVCELMSNDSFIWYIKTNPATSLNPVDPDSLPPFVSTTMNGLYCLTCNKIKRYEKLIRYSDR